MNLDKINRLAEQALSAPEPEPTSAAPKPAAPPPAAGAQTAPTAMQPAAATTVATAPEPALGDHSKTVDTSSTEHQSDPKLIAMMEERQQKLNKRWKRYRMAVGLIIFALFASGGASYSFVPKVRNAVDGIVMDIKSSKDDVKSLGSVMESFDEQLEQVAVRGEQIDNATELLGVDPNSVGEGDDLNMESEMRELMGDDAVTVTDRSRTLQSTFGIVQTAAGRGGKHDKKKAESSDQ